MMRALPSPAASVAAFALPDRPAPAQRLIRLRGAFDEAYAAIRHRYGIRGATADDPLWGAHHGLLSYYEGRITKLERTLTAALASDGIDDTRRQQILRAVHGTTARDANLLTAAEAEHLRQYRALGQQDRAIVRALIARLSRDHTEGGQ